MKHTYNGFREYVELAGEGIFWDDDRLDYAALDELIREV